jgi:quercetin dioxygenase-like cupin family protein
MEIHEPGRLAEFSAEQHVSRSLLKTVHCAVSVVGWEPRQVSSIHAHPGADELYHVLEGEGLFSDGRRELRLGPGHLAVFPAGEVHRVQAVTRLVLCRIQAGTDRGRERHDGWPQPGP